MSKYIDVPAIFDDSDHIFDRHRSGGQKEDFKSWRDKVFANFVTDCEANHGAVLKPYLKKIITADFDVEKEVQDATAFFVRSVVDAADDVVARDVAGKFGLVYAGGLLGICLGILLWPRDELLDAIAKCYRGARNQLPDEGVALRRVLPFFRPVWKSSITSNRRRRKPSPTGTKSTGIGSRCLIKIVMLSSERCSMCFFRRHSKGILFSNG
jgi:hypothetical protein